MRPSTIPKESLITLATGARQLVVHDALLEKRAQLVNKINHASAGF